MEAFGRESESQGMGSAPHSVSGDQSLHEAQGVPSCLDSTAESEGTPLGPPADPQDGGPGGAPDDMSKPWGLGGEEAAGSRPFDQQMAEGVNSKKLHQFRTQLHQLSRQKDGLMPKPDGTFPTDWLGLAWEYQALAEHVIRSAWPCCYPEGLLPCVSQQVDYLKRRLEEFPSIPMPEKDKFQRLFILAALGIIAKMKLVTFCWTFVELKQNESKAGGKGMSLYLSQIRQSPLKGARRLSGVQIQAGGPAGGPPGGPSTLDDIERTEYTTRSGRKTHRTAMKPEKA